MALPHDRRCWLRAVELVGREQQATLHWFQSRSLRTSSVQIDGRLLAHAVDHEDVSAVREDVGARTGQKLKLGRRLAVGKFLDHLRHVSVVTSATRPQLECSAGKHARTVSTDMCCPSTVRACACSVSHCSTHG